MTRSKNKNVSPERWRQAPLLECVREPSDLDAGTAGEHLVCADLLLAGFVAFRSDQNCSYDVAVELGGRLVRVQVKATRCARPAPGSNGDQLLYQWSVRRAKGAKRTYADGEFDILALVGLDIRQVAYLPPSHVRQLIHIRPEGAVGRGKRFADYPFVRALHELEETA